MTAGCIAAALYPSYPPADLVRTVQTIGARAVIVEDAATFMGNAEKKAVAYSKLAPGLLVFADDSGLEVDALGGQPGVRSARFADDLGFEVGAGTKDERNNRAVVSIDGVRDKLRVLMSVDPDELPTLAALAGHWASAREQDSYELGLGPLVAGLLGER